MKLEDISALESFASSALGENSSVTIHISKFEQIGQDRKSIIHLILQYDELDTKRYIFRKGYGDPYKSDDFDIEITKLS